MKKYQIALMNNPGWETKVHLITTDLQLFEEFLAEIKKSFPKSRISIHGDYPSGQGYACYVEQLSGKDWQVSLWLLNHLCNNGWEPFAVEERNYHFRRMSDQN